LEVLSAIEHKNSGFGVVFLARFSEKRLGYCGRCCGKQPQWSNSFVSGSAAAYSQNCWLLALLKPSIGG